MARPSRRRPLQAALVLALLAWTGVRASDHTGPVTATASPPAVITATSGDATVTTSTNLQGAYACRISRRAPRRSGSRRRASHRFVREVTVGASAEPATCDLALLTFDEITAGNGGAAPGESGIPESQTPATGSPDAGDPAAASTPGFQRASVTTAVAAERIDTEPAVPDSRCGAEDGFLINGSVNNGAATPFAQSAAFGDNRRSVIRLPYRVSLGLNAATRRGTPAPPPSARG